MDQSAIPPAVIADAVAAARALLRMEGDGEAALLARLAGSAIRLGEAFTGTQFFVRTREDVVPASSTWSPLGGTPVRAILGATGLPATGAPFVLANDDYAIDIDPDGRGWVRVLKDEAAGRIAVSYNAGIASTWGTLPEPLAQGVAVLIGHLFDDRAATSAPPAAVAALWRPFRTLHLCGANR